MPRRLTKPTPETRQIVSKIVKEIFHSSPAALAEEAALDLSTLLRLLKGQRPATPEHVGRIMAVVPKGAALELLQAFLTDTARATNARDFNVKVSRA